MGNYLAIFIFIFFILSSEKIVLIDNEYVITGDDEQHRFWIFFFTNIVANLNILQYSNSNRLFDNFTDPILNIYIQTRNHPSLLTSEEVYQRKPTKFLWQTLKRILQRHTKTPIPTRVLKENGNSFVNYLRISSNESVTNCAFPSILKKAKNNTYL